MHQIAITFIVILLTVACGVDEPRMIENGNGDLGCTPALSADYILPYPIGQQYKLIEGNCSSRDHINALRYAFDFEMPHGSIITAARSGVVHFIEEGFGNDDHEQNHHNLVVIAHENGTFGRYLHLAHEGALVEMNQPVNRGDTIALSGSTGLVSSPQLHFDVLQCIDGCPNTSSIAIDFMNAEPPVTSEEISYLAVPF